MIIGSLTHSYAGRSRAWQKRERGEVRLMETRASFIGQNIITPEIIEELSVGRHCLDLAVFALD